MSQYYSPLGNFRRKERQARQFHEQKLFADWVREQQKTAESRELLAQRIAEKAEQLALPQPLKPTHRRRVMQALYRDDKAKQSH